MFQRLRGAFDDLSGYAIKVCLMLCSSRSFDNHCIVCGRYDEVVQRFRGAFDDLNGHAIKVSMFDVMQFSFIR